MLSKQTRGLTSEAVLGILCRVRILTLGLLAFVALGCEKGGRESTVPSSSGQAGYAERYPTAVEGTSQRLGKQEADTKEASGKFAGYPDALKSPPSWAAVNEVYERADASGRSQDYARQAEQARFVTEFMDEEKDGLHRRVAGSVDYAAKQKSCDASLGGAAAGAVDQAVEKQLEERLRAHNEAHRYIDDHEDELGKANADTLRDQADQISKASFLANVGVVLSRQELEAQINESSDVKSTLDRTIEESTKIQQDPKASPGAKKAAKARIDAAQKAQVEIDDNVKQAQAALEKIDERIKQLQDEYQKAFEELKKKVDEKAKAQPEAK